MSRIPIALQLYSIREDCAADFPTALRQVADMGYDGVEFAGLHDHAAPALRQLLDELGLTVAGAHLGLNALHGDALAETIEAQQILGNRFLIVPGLPAEYTASLDAWRRTADVFNELAEKVAPHGMVVGYHNHHTEFSAAADGRIPWHVFLDNTEARVTMQPDIGNALVAGHDLVPDIRRYAGRSRTVHLKEFDADNDTALVGEGKVDWPGVFDTCETVGGTEWYIVEQEKYPHSPLESVRLCLENLKRMGK